MAVVIPLGLKHRNTYLSYNMEANFYLQYFDPIQGIVPAPFATVRHRNSCSLFGFFFKFSNYFETIFRLMNQM